MFHTFFFTVLLLRRRRPSVVGAHAPASPEVSEKGGGWGWGAEGGLGLNQSQKKICFGKKNYYYYYDYYCYYFNPPLVFWADSSSFLISCPSQFFFPPLPVLNWFHSCHAGLSNRKAAVAAAALLELDAGAADILSDGQTRGSQKRCRGKKISLRLKGATDGRGFSHSDRLGSSKVADALGGSPLCCCDMADALCFF